MKHILYVEDNAINAMVVEISLRNTYKVDIAKDPAEALERVENKHYDLILMDINLGDEKLDGIALSKIIWEKSSYSDVNIILISATDIRDSYQKYLREGFFEFLAKPVSPKKLHDCVARAISTSVTV